MLFNSLTFLVFFAGVFALFWLLPNWRQKKSLLLVASYLFYAAWSPPYVLLLAACTYLDFVLARQIGKRTDGTARRGLLTLSILSNLLVLGYFKYADFLLVNLASALSLAGVAYSPPHAGIILPIGISFYTFASLSYTIDVYRRQIRPDWKFVDYALFVSFFPHLVAGPIVRASCLLPQLAEPRLPDANKVGWGLILVCVGLFAKVVLADTVFGPVVDEVYAAPATFGAVDTWAAVLAFSGQIYYDFSGYSLCAIGIALCFGFSFPDNFRQPYAARGFSDFWRRWHISLSSWLRDYLYVPMGGNRFGKFATYRNLMLTMLIGGIWHGASWMFVLWGCLHGICLAIERACRKPGWEGGSPGLEMKPLLTILTFAVVTLIWVPFRSPNVHVLADIVAGLVHTSLPPVNVFQNLIVFVMIACMLRWQVALRDTTFEQVFTGMRRPVQFAIVAGSLVSIYLASGGNSRAFIYFQF